MNDKKLSVAVATTEDRFELNADHHAVSNVKPYHYAYATAMKKAGMHPTQIVGVASEVISAESLDLFHKQLQAVFRRRTAALRQIERDMHVATAERHPDEAVVATMHRMVDEFAQKM